MTKRVLPICLPGLYDQEHRWSGSINFPGFDLDGRYQFSSLHGEGILILAGFQKW